jgi:PAS domain S-box-containing protein
MMQILFIAPYPEMSGAINAVLQRYPRRNEIMPRIRVVPVEQLDLLTLEPCDAVIARGYSARKIRAAGLDVPLVETDTSGYDVIASVQECRNRFDSRRIAFIGFYSAFNSIVKLAGVFGCDIRLYIPRDVSELPGILQKSQDDGCDAVIGGYSIHALAMEKGINSIGLHSGEESIGLALEEAVRSVELVRQERIKAETYRIITQTMKDGIVYVDASGIIREENLAARELACCELKGRTLAETFPQLMESFFEALRLGREIPGELKQMGGITVSLEYMPVVVQGQPAGVVISFQNITKVQQLERQIRKKLNEKGLVARYHFSNIVYRSRIIKKTIEIARRYALLSSNILISGETGTGKELFAQSIHNASHRKDGPFVAINCAALPDSLLESELFGYVEGAFTGTAKGGKTGLFELAHGGTLFLDEISEIPVSVQSKLLRALQEKEVRRIGGDKVIAVDVRVISATNSDLHERVAHGLFRRDLLYRLNVFNLSLPPLRIRKEDIAALFSFFLARNCRAHSQPIPGVEPAALDVLHACALEGNVRELRNITARVCALRHNPHLLTARDMEQAVHPETAYQEPQSVQTTAYAGRLLSPGAGQRNPHPAPLSRKNETYAQTLQALAACGGDKGRTAVMLGINRSTLWRRLRRYG